MVISKDAAAPDECRSPDISSMLPPSAGPIPCKDRMVWRPPLRLILLSEATSCCAHGRLCMLRLLVQVVDKKRT